MSSYYILYNPIAANSHGKEKSLALKNILKGENFVFEDITSVINYYLLIKVKLLPTEKVKKS